MDLNQQFERETAHLRRQIKRVIHECQEALTEMDKGSRPGPYLGRSGFLGQSVADVEGTAARVDLLLELAGSPLLDRDKVTAALKGTGNI